MLDGGGGDEDDVAEGLDEQAGVDELVGEELVAGVVEGGTELEGAGGGVDLVVERGELAGFDLLDVGAVKGVDRKCALRLQLGLDLRQVVFGDVEDDGDGLKLGDHGEGGGGAGEDDIAGVDETQADATGDGRGDVAVGELDLVVLNGALVSLDGAFILDDGLLLVVELLLGDGVAGVGGAVAVEVDAGLGEDALIVLEGAFSLGEGGLVGARIDVDERLAFVNDLAFLVVNGHDLAGDLAVDGDGEDGGDGAEGVVVDVDIAGMGLGDGDGGGALGSASAASA